MQRRILYAFALICCAFLFGCSSGAQQFIESLPAAAGQQAPPSSGKTAAKEHEAGMAASEDEAATKVPDATMEAGEELAQQFAGANAERNLPKQEAQATLGQPASAENATEKTESAENCAPDSQGKEDEPAITVCMPDPVLAPDMPAALLPGTSPLSDQYVQQVLEAMGMQGAKESIGTATVTHCSDELISCVIDVQSGSQPGLYAYTYSLKEGKQCKLGDFFSNVDTGWRGLMADMVAKQAQERDLMLLCIVPPVMEDHPFYIQNGNIVLLYRPYEITTYEAGFPRFELDMQALNEYMTHAYGIGGIN